MLIAQISDTHILARSSDSAAVQQRADWLTSCIADINRRQPDAVIFTGDTVQTGQDQEYAFLRELLTPLEAPLYLVPGNRDDNSALRRAFPQHTYLPQESQFLHYEVEQHSLRLVAIDSTKAGERKGYFCAQRQQRLDAVLREQADRPTVLFIHHPPFDVEDHYVGGYRHAEEATALTELVQRSPQVKALICGHVHCSVDRDWAGTRAFAMPSVAVDLRKGVDEREAMHRPIYRLHTSSVEGHFSSQTVLAP